MLSSGRMAVTEAKHFQAALFLLAYAYFKQLRSLNSKQLTLER